MKRTRLIIIALLVAAVSAVSLIFARGQAASQNTSDAGYIIERDAEIAKEGPGTHNGLGRSTGYIFFEKVPDLKFSFRKRVLHKGASIGYHLQKTDEVYYIIGGTGKMKINDKEFSVKTGDAILTRGGSSHGLEQTGEGDLTIIITYQKES
jgi:mannose-6-phosphate isomerase-like protein (cupin superfamily)